MIDVKPEAVVVSNNYTKRRRPTLVTPARFHPLRLVGAQFMSEVQVFGGEGIQKCFIAVGFVSGVAAIMARPHLESFHCRRIFEVVYLDPREQNGGVEKNSKGVG